MTASDLDRRTVILAIRQQHARSELMTAFAMDDGPAELEVRQRLHGMLDVELDQLAERLRETLGPHR